LQFVQTVWTTLQNGWSWIVSTAGSVWSWIVNSASSAWNWTVSTASSAWQYVVTLGKAAGEGIAVGVVMVANGFTLGLIPSLSAKANALRGVYGDGVFWACNIAGGVAGTALALAATMATGGMGPAAALGIMGTGAALGVGLDAGHQIAQMADGKQPWWEFNYQELGQAGMLGAYMAPLAPLACAAPAIVPALTALGVANGVQEIMNGEGWTGAYDIATSLILFKLARGSCFAAGTPLLTPTGDKPIEQFQPGDWILTAPEDDPTAPVEAKQVEEVFKNHAVVLELRVGGRVILTTDEHPFWVQGRGWTSAKDLMEGDRLRSHDGRWVVLNGTRRTGNEVPVYNLRIADYHTYFVGSREWGFSVWAHNACGPTSHSEISTGRTKPINLKEQIAMQEAKAGAGKEIIPANKIGDPRFAGGDWAKFEFVHRAPDGTNYTIHYMKNLRTGEMVDFKFVFP